MLVDAPVIDLFVSDRNADAIDTEYEEGDFLAWDNFKTVSEFTRKGTLRPPDGWTFSKDHADPRYLEALMKDGRIRQHEEELAKNIKEIGERPKKWVTMTGLQDKNCTVEDFYLSDYAREGKGMKQFDELTRKMPFMYQMSFASGTFDCLQGSRKASHEFLMSMAMVKGFDALGIQDTVGARRRPSHRANYCIVYFVSVAFIYSTSSKALWPRRWMATWQISTIYAARLLS